MKKLAILFVALAMVVSACGAGDSEVAGTVDGREYTVGDVNALVFDAGETMSKEQFAQFLGFLLQWDIVVNAAMDDYDISHSEDEIEEAGMEIYNANAEEGVSLEDFLEANAVSQDFLDKVAQLQLVEADVGEVLLEEIEPLTDEELEAQRQAAYDNLTEVCVAHILVETEEEANDLFDRLSEGEDFADLAMELSTDTGSGAEGGDLGCSPPTRYVPEFMDATLAADLDVPFGPVESQFGFHAVLVTDRTFPADDELPSDEELLESARNAELPQVLSNWIGDHLEEADVDVSEKFGTWQSSPPGVVPPSDDAPSGETTTTVAEETDEETTTTTGDG